MLVPEGDVRRALLGGRRQHTTPTLRPCAQRELRQGRRRALERGPFRAGHRRPRGTGVTGCPSGLGTEGGAGGAVRGEPGMPPAVPDGQGLPSLTSGCWRHLGPERRGPVELPSAWGRHGVWPGRGLAGPLCSLEAVHRLWLYL